jgi:ADP-ribose pyrophosphatase YjhB (NUDIX family)
MKYCSECGSDQLFIQIPEGDNRPRQVCANCGMIYYQNPKVITGCLVQHQGKVLLCRRAIEPRYGLWTIPAGFMENQETLQQAAMRETWEEAQAKVTALRLYALFSIPYISQVYVMFLAQLSPENPTFAAGTESLAVDLFDENSTPWETLAFTVIKTTLTHYFQDQKTGQFPMRIGEIVDSTVSISTVIA